jgi:hypothetical protein
MYFIYLTSIYSTESESIRIKNTGSSIEGGGAAFPEGESGMSSFGAKVVPSLNRVDPSFMNSVAGSYLQAKWLKYLT